MAREGDRADEPADAASAVGNENEVRRELAERWSTYQIATRNLGGAMPVCSVQQRSCGRTIRTRYGAEAEAEAAVLWGHLGETYK